MRCCTAYRALLDRLGVTDLTTLQPRLDVRGRARRDGVRGAAAARRAAGAAAPGARRCAATPCCRVADRLRAVRAALALRRRRPRRPARRRPRRSATGCRAHGQTPATVDALWDLVGIARSTRAPTTRRSRSRRRCSRSACSPTADAADIGWSHGAAAAAARRRRPSAHWPRPAPRCAPHTRVEALAPTARGWEVRTARRRHRRPTRRGRSPSAGAHRALLPAGRGAARAGLVATARAPRRSSTCTWSTTGRCSTSRSSPASAHRCSGCSTARGRRGLPSGQYLAVSLSAADDVIDVPVASCANGFLPELAAAAPGGATAHGCSTSSSPGNGRRRSARRRAARALRPGHAPRRTPGCSSPARGPPPAGPRRWRARCAAASAAAAARVWRRRPRPRPVVAA